MSASAEPATSLPSAPATSDAQRVAEHLRRIAHLLPAQAPLRDFVHHNTLHAFQHLPFAQALASAARVNAARPWLGDEQCRKLLREGRIKPDDLAAGLRQLPDSDLARPLVGTASRSLSRGEVLLASLQLPFGDLSAIRWRWQIEEHDALRRWQPDLPPATRKRLQDAAASCGLDEPAAVADLWAAARDLSAGAGITPASSSWQAWPTPASPAPAEDLWPTLADRLGGEWTMADLLAHLTGEDFRHALQPLLIRHLAAHLDRGLAAWKNPLQAQGFYLAWRDSARIDWAWDLDEFAGARGEVAQLSDDPWQTMVSELPKLVHDAARWHGYLQRLAFELPGWAGMVHWREEHRLPGDPPIALIDLLAVRVVLERLHAEQLVRRIWRLPLSALGDHLRASPAELCVRHAFGCGGLAEEDAARVRRQLALPPGDAGWQELAAHLTSGGPLAQQGEQAGGAACMLFLLAQRLGLGGSELRDLGGEGARELLRCATSLSAHARAQVWLLAYERHYRQRLFAALLANHGRMQAARPPAVAQFIFCMDDREEGTRRHLEEVNPAVETFGAAGFFGIPMWWQGIDDAQPTALCPIVVQPVNTVRECVPTTAMAALQEHRRRRQTRLLWLERWQHAGRRGALPALVCSTGGAPLGLLALLGRTLAPGRFGALLARWREAVDRPVATTVRCSAEVSETHRPASAQAPREGFSEDEQVARVGGFLRSIGLADHFAPLVVVVGHGSDSRNNPHLAAYDCGACSGRHGGPNARVLAAMANLPAVRSRLASEGLVIPQSTVFVGAEHNTCDETFVWYDLAQLPSSHQDAFSALRRDCEQAAARHAVERCRRFASAPPRPSAKEAREHLANRRQSIAQARPELGHATVAAAFVGRRAMSRGIFLDRRVFLISYDPLSDADGRILEATLLAAGPVGAGINLEYYFSTVDNEGFGCGSKVVHNVTGMFGVMQGTSSDLRTGLPLQMIEVHEPMRLLVVVEQSLDLVNTIYRRQPPLQELIGNGWIVLAAKDPHAARVHLFHPEHGWQAWTAAASEEPAVVPVVDCSTDWFAGQREALPPALLRRPVAN